MRNLLNALKALIASRRLDRLNVGQRMLLVSIVQYSDDSEVK